MILWAARKGARGAVGSQRQRRLAPSVRSGRAVVVAVDTRYSTEQLELRSAAVALLSDLGPRTVADLDDRHRRARLVAAVADAGWLELRGPGDGDAPLASGVEVALVARELGRAAADAPFLGPVLAADLARQSGVELSGALTSVVFETSLADFAALPPAGSSQGIAVDCADAERGLVLAEDAESIGEFRIHALSLGERSPATDLTRSLASMHLLAAAADDPQGAPILEAGVAQTRALGLAITVADLVGTMEGVLDATCAYTKERQQYGVAIGSFQAVQHLLAEARVLVEGATSVAQYAAWAVDATWTADALQAGAVAKAYCARAARIVCETAIQVHGGIGNTWECFVHVYLRRALLSSALFGDEGHHLRALARRRLGYDRGL